MLMRPQELSYQLQKEILKSNLNFQRFTIEQKHKTDYTDILEDLSTFTVIWSKRTFKAAVTGSTTEIIYLNNYSKKNYIQSIKYVIGLHVRLKICCIPKLVPNLAKLYLIPF